MSTTHLQALVLALASASLTVLGLAYTESEDLVSRLPLTATIITFSYRLFTTLQNAITNRLWLALLSTAIWIHCLKTIDDMCITGVSFSGYKTACDNEVNGQQQQQQLKQMTAHPRSTSQLSWGLQMLFNARGIGTPWQINKIPPWYPRQSTVVPTRLREVGRHCRNLLLASLVVDLIHNRPPSPSDIWVFMSPAHESFFPAVKLLSPTQLLFRLLVVLGAWINIYCLVTVINSLLSLFSLVVVCQDQRSCPPVFGLLQDAWTVRRFWGVAWHQTLRRLLTSITEFVVDDVLCVKRFVGPSVSRYVKLVMAFWVSGQLHRAADMCLRVPAKQSNAVRYFVAMAGCIICEDTVQGVWRRVRVGVDDDHGLKRSKGVWKKYVGYLWVGLVMFWMTPAWTYPAARHIRPDRDALLPVSFVQLWGARLGGEVER